MAEFDEVGAFSLPSFVFLMAPLPLQRSELQAEKRGNFVVIGLVDGSRVVSWSLNVRSPFPLCCAGLLILTPVDATGFEQLGNPPTVSLHRASLLSVQAGLNRPSVTR